VFVTSLFIVFSTACQAESETQEKEQSAIHHDEYQSTIHQDEYQSIDLESNSESSVVSQPQESVYEKKKKKGRIYDSDGRQATYVADIDGLAYFRHTVISDFGLNDWEVDFPIAPYPIGSTIYYPENATYDWSRYQNRLFMAEYNIRICHTLESDIDRIIMYNLAVDNVVSYICSSTFDNSQDVIFLNTDIFYKFVSERVEIEIIDDTQQKTDDFYNQEHFNWEVIEGGCHFGINEYCYKHVYTIWLVNFNNQDRTILDMRTVTNPGCGCPFTR
jgi:hypothetical protein